MADRLEKYRNLKTKEERLGFNGPKTKKVLIDIYISDLVEMKNHVTKKTASENVLHEIEETLNEGLGKDYGSGAINSNFSKYGFKSWSEFYKEIKKRKERGYIRNFCNHK
jgi:hypothetical protein